MPGRRKLLALQAALGLFALAAAVACGRSAAPKVAAEQPAPADSAPAAPAAAGSVKESDASAAPGDDAMSDHADEEKLPKKKADEQGEEPSLSQPPRAGPLPSDDDELEQLGREERQFQQALDPEALSCAGALPRRDAICSLAEKICELTPPTHSLSAQEDCDKARSACTDAKAAYRKRCGG